MDYWKMSKLMMMAVATGVLTGWSLGLLNGAMAFWLSAGAIAGVAYGLVLARRALVLARAVSVRRLRRGE